MLFAATDQAGILNRGAVVHDDLEAGRAHLLGRRLVHDIELHPHEFGADLDRVQRWRGGVGGVAEDVDHVDPAGLVFRDVLEGRIDRLAVERLAGEAGVDRDHPVALRLQEAHHAVAVAVRLVAGAHQHDGLGLGQDLAQERIAGTRGHEDQSSSLWPRRPARSWMNCQATRPERAPRVTDHSLASARSWAWSILMPMAST